MTDTTKPDTTTPEALQAEKALAEQAQPARSVLTSASSARKSGA